MGRDAETRDPGRRAASRDGSAACALSADGLAERLAWIRSAILPHVVASEPAPDGIVWELEDAPGLAERLERLRALESACCPGLAIEVAPGARPGRRRVSIRGIDPRASLFAPLPRSGD